MNNIVYLTYPLLLGVLIVGAKWYVGNRWNEEFMTLKQTKYLQGFFAICIMLHHIAQEMCASWQTYPTYPGLDVFVSTGYCFVGIFMLCSGYGLYKSYQSKPNYLDGFMKKRVLPIVLAFYTTGLIFFVARILMKEKMNGWKIFCYISGFGLPNPNAWFVVAMPYFYLCFYLSFRFLKNDTQKIAGTVFGIFLYTFLGTCINHNGYWMGGEWWYNTAHLLWIGLLFARYEKQIVEKIKKHYWLYLLLAGVALLVFGFGAYRARAFVSYYGEYNPFLTHFMVVRNRWICLLAEMLASTSFASFVFMLNLKWKIGNRFLGVMGTLTLEFYLIHGLFLELFSFRFCDIVPSIVRITSIPLQIIVVFILSVPAAFGVKKFDNWLYHLLIKRK